MYSLEAVASAAERSALSTFVFAVSAAALITRCAVWPTKAAPLFATLAAASPIERAFGFAERFEDPVLVVADRGLLRAKAVGRDLCWLEFRPFGPRFAGMVV